MISIKKKQGPFCQLEKESSLQIKKNTINLSIFLFGPGELNILIYKLRVLFLSNSSLIRISLIFLISKIGKN